MPWMTLWCTARSEMYCVQIERLPPWIVEWLISPCVAWLTPMLPELPASQPSDYGGALRTEAGDMFKLAAISGIEPYSSCLDRSC